jgi:predicted metal-binding membrane protein
MKSIFELTKREQRIVIVVVAALVAIAFAKHLLENRSRPLPAESTPNPTSSPTVHSEEEQPDSDDSR